MVLLPVYATSSFTLVTSSEYATAVLIWGGIYSFLYFGEKRSFGMLILSNVCFCLAYLCRPESIALFGVSFLINVVKVKPRECFRKELLCYIVPFVAVAFPYIWFLRNTTGVWTISGKDKYNSELVAQIYDNSIFVRITNSIIKFIGMYASLNLFNPLIYGGIVALIARALRGNISRNVEYYRLLTLIAFVIPVNLALLYYLLGGAR